jgi:hypothetical protein
MNNVLYLMMSCIEKNKNPNEPIHLFTTRGASTCRTFTLMLLIQALICFYNRHPHLDLFKKKALFMAYIGKTTFNINGTKIDSSPSLPFNCKDLPPLNLE